MKESLFHVCSSSPTPQVTKLRDEMAKVQQVLTDKETESAETIKAAAGELQKASLKLFEMAYRKVSSPVLSLVSCSTLTGGWICSTLVSF